MVNAHSVNTAGQVGLDQNPLVSVSKGHSFLVSVKFSSRYPSNLRRLFLEASLRRAA
jgi:hypothetical protein